MDTSPQIREKIIRDISSAIDEGKAARAVSLAKSMTTVSQADEFLADLTVMNSYANPLDYYGFAISAMSSPQARLDAFQKMSNKSRSVDFSTLDNSKLQAWGVTRAQVEQIFAQRGKTEPGNQ